MTDHCACCTLLAVPEVVGPKCLEDGEVYCADCAFAKTSEELGRLRAENERFRKFAESAAAAFHDLDYERGYLHARAVLAGASDEQEAPRG